MYAMSGVVDTVHLRKSHVQSLRGAVVLDDQTPLGFLLLTLVFYATPLPSPTKWYSGVAQTCM
jgi:hypothetical protein